MFDDLKRAVRSTSGVSNTEGANPESVDGAAAQSPAIVNPAIVYGDVPSRATHEEQDSNPMPLASCISVCVIGDNGHGKTTLIDALSKALALHASTYASSSDTASVRPIKPMGASDPSTAMFSIGNRTYACREVAPQSNVLAETRQSLSSADIALLVISAPDGPMAGTTDLINLLAEIRTPFIVLLNKCDIVDDDMLIDLICDEVRTCLDDSGLSPFAAPIVRGSALKALSSSAMDTSAKDYQCVWEAITALDKSFSMAEQSAKHDPSSDFLLSIENVFTVTGRGTVAAGKVLRGSVYMDDRIEVVLGNGKRMATEVKAIEMYRKLIDHAEKGDAVGILMRGIKKEDVLDSRFLVNPGGFVF